MTLPETFPDTAESGRLRVLSGPAGGRRSQAERPWRAGAPLTWMLVPILLVCLGTLPAAAAAATANTMQRIRALIEGDSAARFEAALALLRDDRPGTEEALSQALGDRAVLESTQARMALQFVADKRAGRVPEPPGEGSPRAGVEGVILISIDTLRADHLGCYGYGRATSPVIDSLAAGGAVFEKAVAPAPWTLPTHMSLFTSLYPSFHKLEKGGKIGNLKLDAGERTLPEILKEAGFHTAGFVANPFLDESWGFGRGFDYYRRYVTDAGAQSRRAALWIEWHRYHAARGQAPGRFFLFVHYIDPHEPYSAPRVFRDQFTGAYRGTLAPSDRIVSRFLDKEFDSSQDFDYVVSLYDAEVRFVDESLRRIIESLETTGARDNTLIVITSDHGEEFKDHGSMGHKGTLYDEQLLVPLVVSLPGRIAPGTRVLSQVSLLDIAPTIGEATGAGISGLRQGISLLPYLPSSPGGSARPLPRRTLFAELGPLGVKWEGRRYRRAARTDELKLILTYTREGLSARELYDLKSDPGETTNLWAARGNEKKVKELEARLVEFIREGSAYNPGFGDRNSITLDEEMIEKLRSLGYIDG